MGRGIPGRCVGLLLAVLAVAATVGLAQDQPGGDPIAVEQCREILEPGEYRLATDLFAQSAPCLSVEASDVDLDGANHTVTTGSAAGAGIELGTGEGDLRNITLHDVTVEGFVPANVYVQRADNVRVDRVQVQGARGIDGLRVERSQTVTIREVQAVDNPTGIEVTDSSDVRVVDTQARSSTEDGYRFADAREVRLTDSHAADNGDAGLRATGRTSIEVRRGSLADNDVGASADAGARVLLSQVGLRDSTGPTLSAGEGGRVRLDGAGLLGWTLDGQVQEANVSRIEVPQPPPRPREALDLALEVVETTDDGYANLTAGFDPGTVPDYQEPTTRWWRFDGESWAEASGFNAADVGASTVSTNATRGGILAPTVEADLSPPTTTLEATSAWTNRTVDLAFEARDDLSGVDRTRYRVDNAAASTYTEPVPLSSEGNHTVRYWSIDRAGNEEDPNASAVRIDRTPPSTTARLEGPIREDGSVAAPANVSIEASDELSGVASTRVRVDGAAWRTVSGTLRLTEPGNHTVAFRSQDRAGNVEPVERLNVRVVESEGGTGTGGASAGDGAAELRVRPTEGASPADTTEVTVVNASRPESTRLVLVHPDGATETLAAGTSARWDTSAYPNGYYEVEAVETGPDGDEVTLASTTHLVEHARAGPVEAALAVGTGVLVIAAARAAGGVAGRLLGWLRYVAKVIRRALGIEYRERTKDRTTLRERLKREGGAALVAAAVLATVATLSGVPDWLLGPFLDRLPELGAAAVVFSLVWYGGDWLIARVTGQTPRYRLLGSGLVSLGLSTTLFRSPFGTPGYVRKLEQPTLEGVDETTFLAQRSLADLGVITSSVLVFLPAMRWVSYGFGQAGLLLVVMTVATGAVPLPPLPMHKVWRWRRTAAVVAFAAGVGLYLAWQAAWLPDALLAGLGIAGVLGAGGFAVRHAGPGADASATSDGSRTS